eukprot:TRINITY_DN9201_c0_g1_i2.p2 TRINITY_DN9201_c0_g1~~TRINITY_DN9201_c0_g1_i2.p2  ORF type:complete len:126 (-),score=42.16 TRINITY_DN9201_c0_g1_i2:563-940(-)
MGMENVEDIERWEPEVEETGKDKDKREAQEKTDEFKEYGGSVSVCKLLSLASVGEMMVFLLGILGALASGAWQPMACLMLGELIDSPAPNSQPAADAAATMGAVAAGDMAAMQAAAKEVLLEKIG